MPLSEGTWITLNNGDKKTIEELKINDELITYSIDGLENIQNIEILEKQELLTFNGSFQESKIKNIWLDLSDKIYKINDSLLSDGSHYIFIKRNNKYCWSEIQYCLTGDELFKIDNTWEKIEKIENIDYKLKVYNVQMNRIYNYFANGYLVHNGSPCNACAACGAQSEEEEGY